MRKRMISILFAGIICAGTGSLVFAAESETPETAKTGDLQDTERGSSDEQHDGAHKMGEKPDGERAPGGRGGNVGGNGGGMAENEEEVQSVIDENTSKFGQYSYTDEASGITIEYSLFIPKDYVEGTEYPMIMYIPDSSGAGKSAEEIVEQYYGADVWVTDEDQAKHPSFVMVPALSGSVVDDNWNVSEQVEVVVNLIGELQEQYSIDADRLYTTGQSMGCMISLYLNSRYPDLFAASMFVGGQWDISVLDVLEEQTFFYIVSGGDDKASGGQNEVKQMFDVDDVPYSYSGWSAQEDPDSQNAMVEELLKEGNKANMICFDTGSVFKDGQSGSEHMYSFNYAYKLTAVRDWLFEQSR